ncbi:MAG: hypothetical protein D6770_02145, partial [Anaerolineae bacterium]
MSDLAYSSVSGLPERRFRGRLARSLLWTFLILTIIPLALVAAGGYFRARALLRNQAGEQIETTTITQA